MPSFRRSRLPLPGDAVRRQALKESHAAAEERRYQRECAEIDAELDREEEARREASTAPPLADDPLSRTVAQLVSERNSERERRLAIPGSTKGDPWFAPGAQIRRDLKNTRRAERQRVKREREEGALGVPAMRQAWQSSRDAIEETRRAAIRDAEERCETAKREAREREARELEELGPEPKLENVQAAA